MKKTRSHSKKGLIILIIITVVLCAVTVLKKQEQPEEYTENKSDYIDSVRPDIDVELLTPNEYSRAGIATNKITGIVIHYTANPGASAMNNRDYFEGLKDSHITKASSNFVVGLEAALQPHAVQQAHGPAGHGQPVPYAGFDLHADSPFSTRGKKYSPISFCRIPSSSHIAVISVLVHGLCPCILPLMVSRPMPMYSATS